jgi:hypothetical protein
MDYENIITGERVQQFASVYLGFPDDFNYNPVIRQQRDKHFDLQNLSDTFDNPYYVFCYTHRIDELSSKIHLFKNDFVLITHNSHREVRNTAEVNLILSSPKLKRWYCQNMCFEQEKLFFVPIGFANSMWPHGNINVFKHTFFTYNLTTKTRPVYFNFNINTNVVKRVECLEALKNKVPWLTNVSPFENLIRLRQHAFCICPEGHGVDTHRLWEALYVKTVPIVIDSEFTRILQKHKVPLVVLDKWGDLDVSKLRYKDYNFDHPEFQKISCFILLLTT